MGYDYSNLGLNITGTDGEPIAQEMARSRSTKHPPPTEVEGNDGCKQSYLAKKVLVYQI